MRPGEGEAIELESRSLGHIQTWNHVRPIGWAGAKEVYGATAIVIYA